MLAVNVYGSFLEFNKGRCMSSQMIEEAYNNLQKNKKLKNPQFRILNNRIS